MRFLALPILLAALTAPWTATSFADSRTVRIEPRPFYGATVTLEEGVRVFRPLPPHDRVIINPGSKTPISLGFSESYNYNSSYDGDADYAAADRGYAGGYGFIPGTRHLRKHRNRHMGHHGSFPGGRKH